MKKYLWVVYPLFTIVFLIVSIHKVNVARTRTIKKFDKAYKESEKLSNEPLNSVFDDSLEIPSMESENVEEEPTYEPIGLVEPEPEPEPEPVEEVQTPVSDSYTTRMTSFYANDGYGTNNCTGSGLCEWDFGVNEHGWYTYGGKLVVATATTYLANQGWQVGSGVHLYKYYEELVLTIDGVEYDAVILDSCGSSMKNDRIDLFVSNSGSVKDTMIEVRRK